MNFDFTTLGTYPLNHISFQTFAPIDSLFTLPANTLLFRGRKNANAVNDTPIWFSSLDVAIIYAHDNKGSIDVYRTVADTYLIDIRTLKTYLTLPVVVKAYNQKIMMTTQGNADQQILDLQNFLSTIAALGVNRTAQQEMLKLLKFTDTDANPLIRECLAGSSSSSPECCRLSVYSLDENMIDFLRRYPITHSGKQVTGYIAPQMKNECEVNLAEEICFYHADFYDKGMIEKIETINLSVTPNATIKTNCCINVISESQVQAPPKTTKYSINATDAGIGIVLSGGTCNKRRTKIYTIPPKRAPKWLTKSAKLFGEH